MTSINNIASSLLGNTYSGEVNVELANDKLILKYGTDSSTFFAPNPVYTVTGNEEVAVPSGNYKFQFEDGFLVDVLGTGPTSTPPPTAVSAALDVFDKNLFQYRMK